MQKIKLGDVLNVKRGASLSGDYYAEEGRYVRLTLGNFNYPGGGFKVNTSKNDIYFVGPIKPEFILNEGDIITPLTEQVSGLLGETATIPESQKYIQSGDVGLVIPDESKLDKRFTYYLIASPIVKKQLGAAAQQTKIRHTSPDAIKACEAWIPEEISVQASIGKLLDSMNEKIANNNLICSNLESMAKLLYDYWFVQFDFPDENGKPYKSSGGKMVWNEELKREIPDGWEVNSLSEICDLSNGINYDKNEPGNKEYKIVNVRNITASSLLLNEEDFDRITLKSSLGDKYLIHDNDILIARSGTPGAIRLLEKVNDNTIYCGFIIRCSLYDKAIRNYICYYLKMFEGTNATKTGGSILQNVSQETLNMIKIPMPKSDLIASFNKSTAPIIKNMQNSINENQELASLRDFLLPMLMNGQVKVKKEDGNE